MSSKESKYLQCSLLLDFIFFFFWVHLTCDVHIREEFSALEQKFSIKGGHQTGSEVFYEVMVNIRSKRW